MTARHVAALIGLLGIVGCATPIQMEYDAEVNRLCAMDGGVVVHEIVRLPPHRFNAHGNVLLRSKSYALPSDEYYYEMETRYLRGGKREGDTKLVRHEARAIRRADGKVLGTSVWYARGGGDPPGPWHPSSYICPRISKEAPSLERSVFVPDPG